MTQFEELKALIASAEADVEKFDGGKNQAAGTRVRKIMLEVKQKAQEVRVTIQEQKNAK